MTDGRAEITRVATKLVYQNRWMRVREDAILRQDGSPGIYGVVERSDFVIVVPVEPDGSVHLVEQYRYPVGARLWEFPQGSWEGAPEADPLDVARGELREETGLLAERMTYAGRLLQGPGFCTQAGRVFLAEGLRPTEAALEQEEQGLITRRFTAAALVEMVCTAAVRDATSLAALALLQAKGLYPALTGGPAARQSGSSGKSTPA